MDELVAAIEAAETWDERMTAVDAGVSWLFKTYGEPGPSWQMPEGQQLWPYWSDFTADTEMSIAAETKELERRILTRDWSVLPAQKPFRCPNGLMSNDPFAFGDPFTGERLYWTPDEWYRANH